VNFYWLLFRKLFPPFLKKT